MKSKTHPPSHPPHKKKKRSWTQPFYFVMGCVLGLGLIVVGGGFYFESVYKDKVYPHVFIAGEDFTGKTAAEVSSHWLTRNAPFADLSFTFSYENQIATLSAETLDIGFDASLSATQALSIGRSVNVLTNFSTKYKALTQGVRLEPLFKWKEAELDHALEELGHQINIEPENALFEFQNGRVAAFKLAKAGRKLDTAATKKQFLDQLARLSSETNPPTQLAFTLVVTPVEPLITNEKGNDLGITELIGKGESLFRGSIAGRVHNVALAASRINGTLIPPGTTFSFNQTLGDISAATGYKQAYVIKSGRTVLDDGGGVCQVSTTLFRAALDAGLSITERHAHSYRVSYYEQGGWKPGFDATVYAPTYDLKFHNDTPTHILIQAKTDTANTHLVFELYGKSDGRVAETTPVKLTDPRPAPPDLIQDDPTLPTGQMKQVDWATAGIKSTYDYTVKRNGEEIFKKTFFSNYVPWQAVFLKGTGPAT